MPPPGPRRLPGRAEASAPRERRDASTCLPRTLFRRRGRRTGSARPAGASALARPGRRDWDSVAVRSDRVDGPGAQGHLRAGSLRPAPPRGDRRAFGTRCRPRPSDRPRRSGPMTVTGRSVGRILDVAKGFGPSQNGRRSASAAARWTPTAARRARRPRSLADSGRGSGSPIPVPPSSGGPFAIEGLRLRMTPGDGLAWTGSAPAAPGRRSPFGVRRGRGDHTGTCGMIGSRGIDRHDAMERDLARPWRRSATGPPSPATPRCRPRPSSPRSPPSRARRVPRSPTPLGSTCRAIRQSRSPPLREPHGRGRRCHPSRRAPRVRRPGRRSGDGGRTLKGVPTLAWNAATDCPTWPTCGISPSPRAVVMTWP